VGDIIDECFQGILITANSAAILHRDRLVPWKQNKKPLRTSPYTRVGTKPLDYYSFEGLLVNVW